MRLSAAAAAVLAFTVLLGCASNPPYVPTGASMTVTQARHTLESLLPGKYARGGGRMKLITDVRLRRDGVGLLWIEGRVVNDSVISAHYEYDNPKTLKVCYFDLITPRVTDDDVFGFCDVDLVLNSEAEARSVADALYALKANAR